MRHYVRIIRLRVRRRLAFPVLSMRRSPGRSLSGRGFHSLAGEAKGLSGQLEEGFNLQVFVRDNNVDQALRALKKKMQREGIFREMKARRSYEKPSERRTREKAEAVRRSRKLARKQAQREGLLPKPKKKAPAGRRAA